MSEHKVLLSTSLPSELSSSSQPRRFSSRSKIPKNQSKRVNSKGSTDVLNTLAEVSATIVTPSNILEPGYLSAVSSTQLKHFNYYRGAKTSKYPSLTEAIPVKNFLEIPSAHEDSKSEFSRVVVYVRKNRTYPFTQASFSVCLFDYFGIETDFDHIECFLKDNKVFLQPPDTIKPSKDYELGTPTKGQSWRHVYRFEHPTFCAVHRLSDTGRKNLPKEINEGGVDVGIAVILESSDGKILITKRADHMRTFPGVWVPPGGHMEEGETFEQAGLREVSEETGLSLTDVNLTVLGLWESVHPPVLYEGEPQRHHLVIYLYVVLKLDSTELQALVKLDPSEVSACMWVNEDLVIVVVEGGIPRHHLQMLQIPITIVGANGHSEGLLDPKVLRKKMPAPGRIVERLTTGTRYALKLWLQQRRGSLARFSSDYAIDIKR